MVRGVQQPRRFVNVCGRSSGKFMGHISENLALVSVCPCELLRFTFQPSWRGSSGYDFETEDMVTEWSTHPAKRRAASMADLLWSRSCVSLVGFRVSLAAVSSTLRAQWQTHSTARVQSPRPCYYRLVEERRNRDWLPADRNYRGPP